jgi:hypothetical protein
MHFTVLSATPGAPKGLAPTPNVTETAYIIEACEAHQVPDITDLMAGPILILYTYRGWNLYCEGGVTVYRDDPVSRGGHGYAGEPIIGTTEDVTVSCVTGWYKCQIRYDADY